MAKTLLIDTDVLVDYLRAFPPAVDYLESLEEEPCTSSVVVDSLATSTENDVSGFRRRGVLTAPIAELQEVDTLEQVLSGP